MPARKAAPERRSSRLGRSGRCGAMEDGTGIQGPLRLRALGSENLAVVLLPESAGSAGEALDWLARALPQARTNGGADGGVAALAGGGAAGSTAVVVPESALRAAPPPVGATVDQLWVAFEVSTAYPSAPSMQATAIAIALLGSTLSAARVRWRSLPAAEAMAILIVHQDDLPAATVALAREGHAIGPPGRVCALAPLEHEMQLDRNAQHVGAWSLLRRETSGKMVEEHVVGKGPMRLQAPSGLYIEIRLPSRCDDVKAQESCAGYHSVVDATGGRRLSVRHRVIDFRPPTGCVLCTQVKFDREVMGELSHPKGRCRDEYIEAWTRLDTGPVVALELLSEVIPSGEPRPWQRAGYWLFCGDRYARVLGPRRGEGIVAGACCGSLEQLEAICGSHAVQEELRSLYEASWGRIEAPGTLRIGREAWAPDRTGTLLFDAANGVGGAVTFYQNEVVHHLENGVEQRWRVRDWGFDPFTAATPKLVSTRASRSRSYGSSSESSSGSRSSSEVNDSLVAANKVVSFPAPSAALLATPSATASKAAASTGSSSSRWRSRSASGLELPTAAAAAPKSCTESESSSSGGSKSQSPSRRRTHRKANGKRKREESPKRARSRSRHHRRKHHRRRRHRRGEEEEGGDATRRVQAPAAVVAYPPTGPYHPQVYPYARPEGMVPPRRPPGQDGLPPPGYPPVGGPPHGLLPPGAYAGGHAPPPGAYPGGPPPPGYPHGLPAGYPPGPYGLPTHRGLRPPMPGAWGTLMPHGGPPSGQLQGGAHPPPPHCASAVPPGGGAMPPHGAVPHGVAPHGAPPRQLALPAPASGPLASGIPPMRPPATALPASAPTLAKQQAPPSQQPLPPSQQSPSPASATPAPGAPASSSVALVVAAAEATTPITQQADLALEQPSSCLLPEVGDVALRLRKELGSISEPTSAAAVISEVAMGAKLVVRAPGPPLSAVATSSAPNFAPSGAVDTVLASAGEAAQELPPPTSPVQNGATSVVSAHAEISTPEDQGAAPLADGGLASSASPSTPATAAVSAAPQKSVGVGSGWGDPVGVGSSWGDPVQRRDEALAVVAQPTASPPPALTPPSMQAPMAIPPVMQPPLSAPPASQSPEAQETRIVWFCSQYVIDSNAERKLRLLRPEIQRRVLDEGPLYGVAPSAELIARIERLEASSPQSRDTMPAQNGASDLVSTFVQQNCIDSNAEAALRALPPDTQRRIVEEGPLHGTKNPSAVLMSRIRRVSSSSREARSRSRSPSDFSGIAGLGPKIIPPRDFLADQQCVPFMIAP